MAVVHYHLGSHLLRCEVVDAWSQCTNMSCIPNLQQAPYVTSASNRGSAPVNLSISPCCSKSPAGNEPLDDISNGTAIDHQPLGHLQRNGLDAVPPYMVYRLINLKVVIGWQACEGERRSRCQVILEDLAGKWPAAEAHP